MTIRVFIYPSGISKYVDTHAPSVPRWKKDTTRFEVGVNYNEKRGAQTSIPKPVIERLGKPNNIAFVLHGKRVEIVAANEDAGDSDD